MKLKTFISLLLAPTLMLGMGAAAAEPAKPEEPKEPEKPKKPKDPATSIFRPGKVQPGFRVNRVFPMPDYALPANATPDQMRQMAIRAHRDALSFHWTPAESFLYNKLGGARSNKDFIFNSGEVFASLPYTNGVSSLLHWLQYYDFETGVVTGIDPATIDSTLGNSCATSVMWGWSAVSTTITWYTTYMMNVAHGCRRVGPYTYDPAITNFCKYTTTRICEENGEQTMFESYAAILPADALVRVDNVGNHAIMAIEPAHVERTPDGLIDGEKSTLTYEDQQGSFAHVEEDGIRVHYEGRLSTTKTFAEFFKTSYIPLTAQEFIGEAPYVPATVTYSGKDASTSELNSAFINCPYKIVTVNFILLDQRGKAIANQKMMLQRDMVSGGEVYSFPLASLSLPDFLAAHAEKGKKYRAKIEVLIATGVIFTPLDAEFTYQG